MYYLEQENYWRDDLDGREVVVSIHCITYNHGPYIAQALEGFVMQKTNFRFEAIVHDDASTDDTAAVIRRYAEKYPSIIKPIFETENQYSKNDGSIDRIMGAHLRGRYVAFCEGDDYWTDPLKLQKQVDFLDANPDYSMCCTHIGYFVQKEQKTSQWSIVERDFDYNGMLMHNYVATLTVLIRRYILEEYYNKKIARNWPFGDYPLWVYAASKGRIKRLADLTGYYRNLPNSASHYTDEERRKWWINSEFEMLDTFNELMPVDKEIYFRAFYNRCRDFGKIVAKLKDRKLLDRIKSFYSENKFWSAKFLLICMEKMLWAYPFLEYIDSIRIFRTVPRKYEGFKN